MKMWSSGTRDYEMVRTVKFKGRGQEDWRMRWVESVNDRGNGVYAQMLGVIPGRTSRLPIAVTLRKPKYGWMRYGYVGRKRNDRLHRRPGGYMGYSLLGPEG